MARASLTVVTIILLSIFAGCSDIDSGRSQLLPARLKTAPQAEVARIAKGSEADIVEKMAADRQAYRNGLKSLVEYYMGIGNNMKLGWAKDELKRLDDMPQYSYIVEAGLAGADLKATASINEANYMYQDALNTEKQAGQLLVVKNENMLRLALDKYNQLIKKFPTSDKIDAAAFRAGGICEYFRDYTIALLYYQRAYQWNPKTPNPARFKAAHILDEYLHRRAEALELYQQAVKMENLDQYDMELAQTRIGELTKIGEKLEEKK